MKLNELSSHVSSWFGPDEPSSGIVITSRIRLARNLAGVPFLSTATNEEKNRIVSQLKKVLLSAELGREVFFFSVDQASSVSRSLLVERHLISRHHAQAKGPRAAVISIDELFTAMINEEDHLRIQVFSPGFDLDDCWRRINRIDDIIESSVEYAYDSQLGYLTACPTNVGTGIRVSAMLHLPALTLTGEIKKLIAAASSMSIAIRGLFGEGTEAVGDFFQISNQITLGRSEEQIIDNFANNIIPKIVQYEAVAREQLMLTSPQAIDDKVQRALALLKSAHLISSHEALSLLSHLRLGVNIKRLEHLSIGTVNELFLLTQPAHLQINAGQSLDAQQRDSLRAQLIREKLSQN